MSDEVDNSFIFIIHQQIASLIDLTDKIRDEIQHSSFPASSQVSHYLSQLNFTLLHLSDELSHGLDELKNYRALADINRIVNSSLDLNDVLRIVMDTIVRLTGAERGFLMLRDQSGEFSIRIARNWEQESIEPSDSAVSRTIINRVASDAQPVLTTNAQQDPRFGNQDSIILYHLRSILCVPLTVKNMITGVIYADNRVRTGIFTEKERDLLIAFSHQAAVAIENARLFESIKRALAEVTELKNLMDSIFASIASGVITANFEDEILLWNTAAELILGYSRSVFEDHGLRQIFDPVSPILESYMTTIRETDQAIVGRELKFFSPQRGWVTFRLSLSPLKNASQSTQGVTLVLDDLTEQKRLEGLRRLFEHMVSPKVIHQLDPEKIQLGGTRTQITTLFADIRGYTNLSETLEPEQLVWVLNRYLAVVAEAVLAQDGTIDKFLGDAVMAWFNAPIPQPDHILRSIKAALGIRDAVALLHRELPKSFQLSFGVGIHFGEAVLGLIGSEQQAEYTAIGDSVNTAKRIQEHASGGEILLSGDVYRLIHRQVRVRQVEAILAKGKRQPVEVYSLMGLVE